MGLPAPTSSNFQALYPDGKPTPLSIAVDNWQNEASLDVEWAHGIAPKAKIVILVTPTQDWTEFEIAIQYAMDHKLGHVISNSYGLPELLWGKGTAEGFNQVLKTAAAAGLTVNFSSGDGGDYGTGAPNAGGDSCPACSPYATSIGGTSLGIPTGTGNATTQVGWGNNITYMAFSGIINDPPYFNGFIGGSGGGESTFFAKPSWQKAIPGIGRQQPDISGPADSFTGAILVLNGQVGTIGGTSWASPVFSAIWSLALQKAGHALGQAAPLIASLPSGAVTDIVPVGSVTNPAGIIFDSNGATYYSADALAAPLYSTTQFYGAIPLINPDDLTFGTDSSLTVTKGWDNVTGWGVPAGVSFIDAVAKAK